MTSSGSVFSQTLQDITNTKLEELSKKRDDFEKLKTSTIAAAKSKQDAVEMLTALSNGVKACFAIPVKSRRITKGSINGVRLETDLRNLDRFLDQARFDPSISLKIIGQWKDMLLRHLETQSLRYTYASLYGKLTTEWLSASKLTVAGADDNEMQLSEDFEEIAKRSRLEARQKWEERVFDPIKVNEQVITKYLKSFIQTKEAQNAFTEMREDLQDFEARLTAPGQITEYSLKWVISGLLASDLLQDEKREVLRDFQSNPIVLGEVADVLDMRLNAIEAWSWGAEVPLEQRRQLNGTYNIYMHEDLLQAIFLQFIGVKWSVFFKSAFLKILRAGNIWKSTDIRISTIEKKRREYFLGSFTKRPNVESIRRTIYRQGYFASQLLNTEYQDVSTEEGDVEAVIRSPPMPQAALAYQSAPMPSNAMHSFGMGGDHAGFQAAQQMRRKRRYTDEREDLRNDDEDSDDGYDDTRYKPKNRMDAKQRLLHLLSTDMLIKTRLEGEITCFRSQFENWNPSLPHGTIKAVLSFFGVSEKWLIFFDKFLQAPLRFIDDVCEPRLRRRGTPGAHVLSDVFGEAILFCLDFAINQRTEGEPLWRSHDDFWFWSSSHQKCIAAWKTIDQFNRVMGVALSPQNSGTIRMVKRAGSIVPGDIDSSLPKGDIRWGMLHLNPRSGRFEIDRDMVDKHIDELSRQLKDKEKSIFAWVQAYSTYASVFFTSNFGKPANCFGRDHVDMMLSTHGRIQRTLFSSSQEGVGSVVDWLKAQIKERFGVTNIPDGYLFFPTDLGGLEVKSPFIGLLQIRDCVIESPSAALDKFEEDEKNAYNTAKKAFEERDSWEWQRVVEDPKFQPEDGNTFMSFGEYTRYREQLSYGYSGELRDVFEKLLEQPKEESVEYEANGVVAAALAALWKHKNLKCIKSTSHEMEPYWNWVALLYGPDMIDRFGGLSIVDPGLLPIGMVSLFRSGRVKWQE